MYCCPQVRFSFLLLPMLACFAGSASADELDSLRLYSTSNCLTAPIATYSCVSLTPSSYTPSYPATLNKAAPNLSLLDNEEAESSTHHLLPRSFSYPERFKMAWSTLRQIQGLDLNFKFDRSGAGMNVDMGGLKLNLFVKDGQEQLLETGVFLGIDSHW